MTPEEDTFVRLGEPAPVIDKHGNKRWRNEKGHLHREHDLPAVIYFKSSALYWYKNGLPHRENDLPAVIWSDGTQYWYKNGLKHRDNGPAAIFANGDGHYYKNGKFIK